MSRVQYRIADLFVAIVSVAVVLSFWNRQDTSSYSPLSDNHRLIFSINLALTSIATVVACFARPATFALGYTAFGWPYLFFVLHGSFVEASDCSFWLLSKSSIMGIGLSLVCGLVVNRLLSRPQAEEVGQKGQGTTNHQATG